MTDTVSRRCWIVIALLFGAPSLSLAQPHEVVNAKDGSGVFGYKDTQPRNLRPYAALRSGRLRFRPGERPDRVRCPPLPGPFS